MRQAASQEYFYWLGKRAFSFFGQGVQNIKSQKALYECIDADRAAKVKANVFRSLALYKGFKAE